MPDWQSYAVEDFIPFTPEVYFRLIERVNESSWPIHVLFVVFALAGMGLLYVGRRRLAGILLGVPWLWPGIVFHMRGYADLNWAATYFGWAFCVQAVLLMLCGIFGGFRVLKWARPQGAQWLGWLLFAFGLLFYPLIAPSWGGGWSQSEVFGIHPDPTAIVSLGALMVGAKRWTLWVAAWIPLLWCVLGGLTLQVMEAPWALSLFGVAVLALAGNVYLTIAWRREGANH